MYEWPEELQMVRDAVRQFVDNEIRPHREELEHGDLPPYDLLRKLYKTFGMDTMAADGFDRRIAQEEAASGSELAGVPSGREAGTPRSSDGDQESRGRGAGFTLLLGELLGMSRATISGGMCLGPHMPFHEVCS